MPLITAYNTGTASVTNGSKAVTGSGTAWADAGLTSGDEFWNVGGTASQRIDTVTDNTHMTLVNNWGDTTLSGAAYEVRITPPSASIAGTVRSLLEKLVNGVLALATGQATADGYIPQFDSDGNIIVSSPTTIAAAIQSFFSAIHITGSGYISALIESTASNKSAMFQFKTASLSSLIYNLGKRDDAELGLAGSFGLEDSNSNHYFIVGPNSQASSDVSFGVQALKAGTAATNNIIVGGGDSRMNGHNSGGSKPTDGLTTGSEGVTIYNVAHDGWSVDQTAITGFNDADSHYSYMNRYNFFIAEGGVNCFYYSQTAEQGFQYYAAWCRSRRKAGFKVIACTDVSANDFVGGGTSGTPVDTYTTTYNALIRQNWPEFADVLADIGANTSLSPNGSNFNNATYFQSADKVHWTATMNALVGTYYQSAINFLMAGPGPVDIAYASGNFAASDSMTWTVDSGDQTLLWYAVASGMMTLEWKLDTTSIGGTPATTLYINLPGGRAVAKTTYGLCEINQGSWVMARWIALAGETRIRITKSDGSNFASSTNATYTAGQARFPYY